METITVRFCIADTVVCTAGDDKRYRNHGITSFRPVTMETKPFVEAEIQACRGKEPVQLEEEVADGVSRRERRE